MHLKNFEELTNSKLQITHLLCGCHFSSLRLAPTRQTCNLFVDPSTRPRRCSDCSRDAPRNQPATTKLLPRVHLQHYRHRRERRFPLESNSSTMLRTAWSSKSSSYTRQRCGSQTIRHQLTARQPSIVFVHGLTGDRENTWTAKDAIAPWPQTLLPAKISNARVLTFGYDAYVTELRGMVSNNRIGNHSWNLLTALATHREDDNTVSHTILPGN